MAAQLEMNSTLKTRTPFRGWHVVGALFVIGFMLYGGGLYSFILFVPPIAKEFHWSSAGTAGLVSAFWISAPLSLWAAPLIRRFGEKRLVIAGILIEAISLMVLFTASSLWEMYLLRALAGLGKVIFAITLPVIISKWFSRRFGLAVAVMFSGWNFGGLGLAVLTQYLLSNIGWRATSVSLGVAQLVIALPIALWGLKAASAAEIGQNLDGDSTSQVDHIPDITEVSIPDLSTAPSQPRYFELLRDLIKRPAFLIIMIASSIFYLVPGGVVVHQAAIIEGTQGTAYVASYVLGLTAGCTAIGAIIGGWLFDKFPVKLTAFVTFSLLGGGILCLLAGTYNASPVLLILHAIMFGLGGGMGDIFWLTLLKRRIPNPLFATGWGIWYFLQLAFNVVAPVCAGMIFDNTKSYPFMLAVEVAVLVIPFALALSLAGWRKRSQDGRPASIS